MFSAVARVALNAAAHPAQHARDLADYEHVTIEGHGPSWREAQDACTIPDGAVIMHWRRG